MTVSQEAGAEISIKYVHRKQDGHQRRAGSKVSFLRVQEMEVESTQKLTPTA